MFSDAADYPGLKRPLSHLSPYVGPAETLQSDLQLATWKFSRNAISPATAEFNQGLQSLESITPRWFDIGAEKYRQMRKQGLTPLPGTTLLPSARTITIPSRDPDRTIRCRLIRPSSDNKYAVHGTFLHIHGGGWVLNDEESSDTYLQTIADSCQLVCISVGYRLAPEDPFPAAPEDCQDVAEWLVINALSAYGAPLAFIGGESAGANLAVLTALTLLRAPNLPSTAFSLRGLLLHYGTFSLQWLPSTKNFQRQPCLVLDEAALTNFRNAYLPGSTESQFVDPRVSPFFADLSGVQLPPAFISTGTEDCLLEDSVFMSVRWIMAGGDAVLKVYPGSPHGFILFPPSIHQNTQMALHDVAMFVESHCHHHYTGKL